MRRRPVVLATTLLTLTIAAPALAGEDKGGSSGGGRLGQVSGGIAGARGGASSTPQGGSNYNGCWTCIREYDSWGRVRPRRRIPIYALVTTGVAASVASAQDSPRRKDATVELYAGAQKVHESDGAFHAELSVRDGRFRLAGAISQFYEPRADGGGNLTMTMPSVTGGVRIDDGGATKVFLEAGVVGAVTRNDPVMDSSITGIVGGVRLEHRLARKTSALFDAQRMHFEDDIRATALRVGLRFGVLQASFRVVDFNVGPALYGPELGLRF